VPGSSSSTEKRIEIQKERERRPKKGTRITTGHAPNFTRTTPKIRLLMK
jgi:hypothetical protein